MSEHFVVIFAVIGLIGFACQWLAWRLRLPAILFLLLAGLVVGPVTGVLKPDDVFGELLFPMVSLAVAIILFEGSLTLKFKELTGIASVVWRMVTVGVLVSWLTIASFSHFVLDIGWNLAALFGALVVVTGPTVIGPMLRTVRPKATIANVLRWESILIDPLGALLAVLVFNFIIVEASGGNEWLTTALVFGELVVVGSVLGVLFGYVSGLMLRRKVVPEYLHNFFMLAVVTGAFALSNYLEHESGLLAVTVMGIWLANMKDVETEGILDFKENLSVVLISGLFIILAARVNLSELQALGWQCLAILFFIQFVARPLKVLSATYGSGLSLADKTLIAWIGPRGIIAAAVSALFALRLDMQGYEDARLLVGLTFVVIIGTVVIQSLTAKNLAKWLGVREASPQGVLFIGANPVARKLAAALKSNGYSVRLADSLRPNIAQARMLGLPVFLGNPVSRLAEKEVDLVGIGRMLGCSENEDLNTLAAQRYQREFGKDNIFRLSGQEESARSERHSVSEAMKGKAAFNENLTYSVLLGHFLRGAEVRTTTLSEEFTFADYKTRYAEGAIPLFVIDSKKKLTVVCGELKDDQVVAGNKVIALIKPEALSKQKTDKKAGRKPHLPKTPGLDNPD